MGPGVYVVIGGVPGAGKTTLSRPLARELGLPLIAKDAIKEAFVDGWGDVRDSDESRRIGMASIAVLHAVAREARTAVLEGPFYRGLAEGEIGSYASHVVQVFCDCPLEIALQRCAERDARGERHRAHGTRDRTWHLEDPIAAFAQPLDLDGPVLVLDTTKPVDVSEVAAWVREVAACDV